MDRRRRESCGKDAGRRPGRFLDRLRGATGGFRGQIGHFEGGSPFAPDQPGGQGVRVAVARRRRLGGFLKRLGPDC